MTIFHSIRWPINTDNTSLFANRSVIAEMQADPTGQRILEKWERTVVPKGKSITEQLANIIAEWKDDNIP